MLFQSGFMPSFVPAITATTWNPSDKNANISLDASNLIATIGGAGAYKSLRAIASHSAGKYYYELLPTYSVATGVTIGVGNASASLSAAAGLSGFNSFGYVDGSQNYINSSTILNSYTWVSGDTICIAFDIDHMTMWTRKNASNWNNNPSANPATNSLGMDVSTLAAGPYFPMASGFTSGDVLTTNFGGSAYAQTPPSGFGNW
jgi:hypothetical protein